MKTLLPWFFAITFGAGAAYFYSVVSQQNTELATLRPQAQNLPALRSELESARSATAALQAELDRLKKESDDVLRLRSEVRQLRDEKTQLSKQLVTAMGASASAQEQAQKLKAANQQLQSSVKQNEEVSQHNACLNHLRHLDGAKQQWALEKQKNAKDTPTLQDLAPYFKDGVIPACPAGGAYSLGTVEELPACNIAGHVLTTEPAKP